MAGRPKKSESLHPVSFFGAPPIPHVPRSDYSEHRFTKEQVEQMWSIVGPTVDLHLQMSMPLWKVITFAYMEGLLHGAGLGNRIAGEQPDDFIGGSLSG